MVMRPGQTHGKSRVHKAPAPKKSKSSKKKGKKTAKTPKEEDA